MQKLVVLLFSLGVLTASAQLHPVDKSSSVIFSVKNFGFAVPGTLTGITGDIVFDPANAAAAKFDVNVDATTINTDNESRDEHLRSDDYFAVKNYPHIHFVSQSVKTKGDGFTMEGDLTIKDKTKSITVPFHATASGQGFLFEGTFKMNRRDFGVGGSSTISDNLTVTLKVQAE